MVHFCNSPEKTEIPKYTLSTYPHEDGALPKGLAGGGYSVGMWVSVYGRKYRVQPSPRVLARRAKGARSPFNDGIENNDRGE